MCCALVALLKRARFPGHLRQSCYLTPGVNKKKFHPLHTAPVCLHINDGDISLSSQSFSRVAAKHGKDFCIIWRSYLHCGCFHLFPVPIKFLSSGWFSWVKYSSQREVSAVKLPTYTSSPDIRKRFLGWDCFCLKICKRITILVAIFFNTLGS